MKRFIKCPECSAPILATVTQLSVEMSKIKGIAPHKISFECEHCKSSGFHMDCDTINEFEFLKAISIKQPFAWLIANGYKDIENRSTLKNQRGLVLIHASKGFERNWVDMVNHPTGGELDMAKIICAMPLENSDFKQGGIVGAVHIIDCVQKSESPWFIGQNGFVLSEPIVLPFTPCKGQLGFFTPKID